MQPAASCDDIAIMLAGLVEVDAAGKLTQDDIRTISSALDMVVPYCGRGGSLTDTSDVLSEKLWPPAVMMTDVLWEAQQR